MFETCYNWKGLKEVVARDDDKEQSIRKLLKKIDFLSEDIVKEIMNYDSYQIMANKTIDVMELNQPSSFYCPFCKNELEDSNIENEDIVLECDKCERMIEIYTEEKVNRD